MTVSVVIPASNEAEVIGDCLDSLVQQTVEPQEVIVVDDGSTDETVAAVSRLSRKERGLNLRLLTQAHRGAGAARNRGAAAATGEILVFVDADMRLSRRFLEALTAPIRQGQAKGSFTRVELVSNWHNRWARFWGYRQGMYEPRRLPRDYPADAAVFRAILRAEFERAGGFDESQGYADDWSLSERLGYRAQATRAVVYHRNPASLGAAARQARWAAKRRYRGGALGLGWALLRVFPPPAPVVGVIRALVARPAIEPLVSLVFLYPMFLLITNTAALVGMAEYHLAGKVTR